MYRRGAVTELRQDIGIYMNHHTEAAAQEPFVRRTVDRGKLDYPVEGDVRASTLQIQQNHAKLSIYVNRPRDEGLGMKGTIAPPSLQRSRDQTAPIVSKLGGACNGALLSRPSGAFAAFGHA